MSTVITLGNGKFECELRELSDSLKKQYGFEKNCTIYHDLTRKCYIHTIFDRKNKCHCVLNESKKLSDLSTNIDRENNWTYIDVTLRNCENDQIFYCQHGEYCPESRKLSVGTVTNHGVILAKTESSNWYYIKHEIEKHTGNGYEKTGTYDYMTCHWHDVFDVSKFSKDAMEFSDNTIRYYNTMIESLYGKEWHFGVDRSPSYQRGDVWTIEQKEALIDSIFNQIPIGAIIFAKRDFKTNEDGTIDRLEEIIDGKQRYTTIIDFVCDRFRYRGKLYSELHPYNRNRFDSSQVMLGEMTFRYGNGKYNEKEVLETFIRLNIGGTSMDERIIESAKNRLKEID